jgi:hypothetical protein
VTQPNEDQKIKNIELVMKLIDKMPEPRAGLVKKMMEGWVGEQYFTAPASGREEYHSCYPGGLCQHSLNVVKNLKKICDAMAPGKYDAATISFVGLFHDLGKAGVEGEPLYVPNPSDWHREKVGKLYETNKDCPFMPTSERSLYTLQRHGIVLENDEYLAIRLNDGQYDETNRNYRMKEPELALFLHWADMYSTIQEKG